MMADPDIFAEERALKEQAERPAAPAVANPYPEGSELWSWWNDQKKPAAPQGFAADLPPTGNSGYKPDASAVYHGGMVPWSRDSGGHTYFDPWGAGPLAGMKQAVTLPGRVYSGETPMPRTFDPSVVTRAQTSPIMGDVLNMAVSTPFGPNINPMIRSGDKAIPGVARNVDLSLATPAGPRLLKEGGKQIEQFKNMAIPYDPAYIGNQLATQMEQAVLEHGVLPPNSKELYAAIRALRNYAPKGNDPGATTSFSPANLIAVRENLAGLFGKQSEHQKGVGAAFRVLNDFIEKPPPEAFVAGSPAFLTEYGPQLYARGRANYAAGSRDADLANIQDAATLRAKSVNSGLNEDASIRSRITSAILNAKKVKGYTPDEKEMLRAVPEGDTGNNIKRYLGNFLGGGGGLGAHISSAVGVGAGHLAGMGDLSWLMAPIPPAIGAALKRSAGTGTKEALDAARATIRQRSPLFREELPGSDVVPNPSALTTPYDILSRASTRPIAGIPAGVPLTGDERRRIIIDNPAETYPFEEQR
jgi:hypothetical protein